MPFLGRCGKKVPYFAASPRRILVTRVKRKREDDSVAIYLIVPFSILGDFFQIGSHLL